MVDTSTPQAGPPTAGRRRRDWLAAGAALAVMAVAGGAVVLANRPSAGAPNHLPAASPGPTGTGAPPAVDHADLVLRNGTEVVASGQVVAAPGKPVRFCPDLPSDLVGHLPGQEPVPECPDSLAVTVIDVRLDRLVDRRTVRGVLTGEAQLRGIWTGDSVKVTDQGRPAAGPDPLADLPGLPASCSSPAGGWLPGDGGAEGGPGTLQPYLDQHQDWFGQPWVTYPEGEPSGATDAPSYTDKPSVLVIPVVAGDIAAIRRQLVVPAHGNLCVVAAAAGTLSVQQSAALNARVQPLMGVPGSLIYMTAANLSGHLEISVAWVDQHLVDTLHRADLDSAILLPWLRPVPR